jgi:hypothetical protein
MATCAILDIAAKFEHRLIPPWETDFSPAVAQEIIFAVRGFMRKLASELP